LWWAGWAGYRAGEVPALVAERYHGDLAPLVIATGGVNRHNGIVEGRMFRDLLTEADVPDSAIRGRGPVLRHLAERGTVAAVLARGPGDGIAGRRVLRLLTVCDCFTLSYRVRA
jgi:hypothetical protein